MKQEWKGIAKGLVLGLALAASVGAMAAWNEPTQAPTAGNPDAPLNVSNTGQSKGGNLVVNGNNQYQNALLAPFGAVVVGDATPETAPGQLKVDVEGKIGGTQYCNENGTQCFTVANLCSHVAGLCL